MENKRGDVMGQALGAGTENEVRAKHPKKALRVTGLILAVLIFNYIGKVAPKNILISHTNSVGHRLFYYKGHVDPKKLKEGDYAVFSIDTSYIPNCHPCQVIKRISCVEGEHLYCNAAGAYYCGNRFLGLAKTKSKKGDPVQPFVFNGVVPINKIFATGGHKDSYDSRYFGFVERSKITGLAIPLI
ncbi:MAG: S26 family signal peptidase [Proteobacteria bacterium]|nr:S26 family signal peptidase [Pseudomonadota bacterium]